MPQSNRRPSIFLPFVRSRSPTADPFSSIFFPPQPAAISVREARPPREPVTAGCLPSPFSSVFSPAAADSFSSVVCTAARLSDHLYTVSPSHVISSQSHCSISFAKIWVRSSQTSTWLRSLTNLKVRGFLLDSLMIVNCMSE
ncbi:uncharacterized protein LOC116405264 [Cucumis sativus]|uniref:uncharacterized protein LOC116405264 n=1 Tax=Cucumis sativus TaxID=3659 RepID=UPI0012F48A49|nr:uncharacterized protein LOC116405264 [Cucumis sativus]